MRRVLYASWELPRRPAQSHRTGRAGRALAGGNERPRLRRGAFRSTVWRPSVPLGTCDDCAGPLTLALPAR